MNNKVILSGGICKRLLARGHIIADIKPKKEDISQSCFIFYQDKYFAKDLDNIMNSKGNDNIEIQQRLKTLGVTEKQYKAIIFEEYLKNI